MSLVGELFDTRSRGVFSRNSQRSAAADSVDTRQASLSLQYQDSVPATPVSQTTLVRDSLVPGTPSVRASLSTPMPPGEEPALSDAADDVEEYPPGTEVICNSSLMIVELPPSANDGCYLCRWPGGTNRALLDFAPQYVRVPGKKRVAVKRPKPAAAPRPATAPKPAVQRRAPKRDAEPRKTPAPKRPPGVRRRFAPLCDDCKAQGAIDCFYCYRVGDKVLVGTKSRHYPGVIYEKDADGCRLLHVVSQGIHRFFQPSDVRPAGLPEAAATPLKADAAAPALEPAPAAPPAPVEAAPPTPEAPRTPPAPPTPPGAAPSPSPAPSTPGAAPFALAPVQPATPPGAAPATPPSTPARSAPSSPEAAPPAPAEVPPTPMELEGSPEVAADGSTDEAQTQLDGQGGVERSPARVEQSPARTELLGSEDIGGTAADAAAIPIPASPAASPAAIPAASPAACPAACPAPSPAPSPAASPVASPVAACIVASPASSRSRFSLNPPTDPPKPPHDARPEEAPMPVPPPDIRRAAKPVPKDVQRQLQGMSQAAALSALRDPRSAARMFPPGKGVYVRIGGAGDQPPVRVGRVLEAAGEDGLVPVQLYLHDYDALLTEKSLLSDEDTGCERELMLTDQVLRVELKQLLPVPCYVLHPPMQSHVWYQKNGKELDAVPEPGSPPALAAKKKVASLSSPEEYPPGTEVVCYRSTMVVVKPPSENDGAYQCKWRTPHNRELRDVPPQYVALPKAKRRRLSEGHRSARSDSGSGTSVSPPEPPTDPPRAAEDRQLPAAVPPPALTDNPADEVRCEVHKLGRDEALRRLRGAGCSGSHYPPGAVLVREQHEAAPGDDVYVVLDDDSPHAFLTDNPVRLGRVESVRCGKVGVRLYAHDIRRVKHPDVNLLCGETAGSGREVSLTTTTVRVDPYFVLPVQCLVLPIRMLKHVWYVGKHFRTGARRFQRLPERETGFFSAVIPV